MKKLIPIVLAYLIIIVGCHKDSGITNLSSSDAFIREAEDFFRKDVLPLPQKGNNISQALIKQPDWKNAFVKRLSVGEVVVVPLIFPKDLYLKLENGKVRLSASEATRLVFYKDSTVGMKAEVVTTLPDSRYLNDTAAGFTGMVWVADWQGQPLRNFRYDPERSVRRLSLAMETSRDSVGNARRMPCAYIDYYYCVSALGYPEECSYSHTVSVDCEEAENVDIGTSGGLGDWDYVDAGGGGGGGSGAGVGVDAYTMLVRPPDPRRIIKDINDYVKCFSKTGDQASYKITLFVDQPVPETRIKAVDGQGNTSSASMNKGSVDVGHTFMTFEQTMPNGSKIRRTMGFYPIGGVSAFKSVKGGFVDDSEHKFDVSISYAINEEFFLNILNGFVLNGYNDYNLNDFNCTYICLDALAKHGIILPSTIGSWIFGKGVNPADLGEDIRSLDLLGATTIEKSTLGGNAQINEGTCY